MPNKPKHVSVTKPSFPVMEIKCDCGRTLYLTKEPYSIICFCHRLLFWETIQTKNVTIIWKKEVKK
jgi:hypothetical protein